MYTENLPAEYQPSDPESVPAIDPAEANRMIQFLEALGNSETLAITPVRQQFGIGWAKLATWLLHPVFKAKWDRVIEVKKLVLDETVFHQGLNPRFGHEDRKLWLKAHHPAYQETKTPQVAVQINIDTTALKKSRDIHKQVNVKDTTTE